MSPPDPAPFDAYQHAGALPCPAQNRRRLELIAKKMNGSLSPAEREEFGRLQTVAHETAAAFDEALLQTIADLRREVTQLPEDSVSDSLRAGNTS